MPFFADRFGVGLACTVCAGCKNDGREPGVIRRQQDEPLADHTRSADDTDSEFSMMKAPIFKLAGKFRLHVTLECNIIQLSVQEKMFLHGEQMSANSNGLIISYSNWPVNVNRRKNQRGEGAVVC